MGKEGEGRAGVGRVTGRWVGRRVVAAGGPGPGTGRLAGARGVREWLPAIRAEEFGGCDCDIGALSYAVCIGAVRRLVYAFQAQI